MNYTFITGASSGIGREISSHLSPERNLILHGRDIARLNETMKLCSSDRKQIIWPFDLIRLDDLEIALSTFLKNNEAHVETFIHCAGILKLLPFRMFADDDIRKTMNVNFFSAAYIILTLLKKSVNEKQLKSIIFISSTASNFGAKAFSIYSASKGALDSLMRSLAVELAPQIRVNSILPGGIKTRMTESIFANSDVTRRMGSEYPLGFGEAQDVAKLVKFLLSDDARWITGQQIVIDGGRSINLSG